MPLVLRRARDGRASAGTPDDYDVWDGALAVGRIFRSSSAPADRPWMWTITGAVVAPRLPSHGFCATLDDAKAAFHHRFRQHGSIDRVACLRARKPRPSGDRAQYALAG
jgi:hypothetical protein